MKRRGRKLWRMATNRWTLSDHVAECSLCQESIRAMEQEPWWQ